MNASDIVQNIDYEREAKKAHKISIAFLCASVFIPVFALTGIFKPDAELMAIWLQRSGSIMVLLGSISEFYAVKMYGVYYPSGFVNIPSPGGKVTDIKKSKKLMLLAAIAISLGTVIWGYGDIVYQYV